jgi:transcriptional regulator with XRE-family HTH domain
MKDNFISRRLTQARETRGFTISELAYLLGTSEDIITELENGTLTPSIEELSRIADILKMPIHYFTFH